MQLRNAVLQMQAEIVPGIGSNTIRGIGIDLVHLPRITALLQRKPAYRLKFPGRILHEHELLRYQDHVSNEEKSTLFLGRW